MPPRMFVVAGPPGSGKSTFFPVSSFGVAHFNADDRAAELNGGSYCSIPQRVRAEVNHEFEVFIHANIESRTSFAIETTLRSSVTFEQASLAKQAGFDVEMRYLALDNFAMHLRRVKARADAGGHSASEGTLRGIYESSLRNLPRAMTEMGHLLVYDNSSITATLRLLLECRRGEIQFEAEDLPEWLDLILNS